LDEIQNVVGFESFVRRFYDNGFKFFITGSSANLLQSDFATKLTGRYVTVFVKPFSFTEYLTSQKISFDISNLSLTEKRASIKKAFDEYFVTGGMPEYIIYRDSEILYRIYQDILYKDVQFRHGAVDMGNLRELTQYLVSNISKKFSYNKMKSMLRIKSVTTIRNYIEYIEETCFGLILRQYHPSVKLQLVNDKKFYVIDPGFIRKISTSGTADRTYTFENLIVIALWSQNPLFYFQNTKECDILVMNENRIQTLYQICFELTPQNRPRELGGLIDAAHSFNLTEGWLITYDQEEENIEENILIHIVPAWKWLILHTRNEIALD
jgi:predicted AAA+ superfamily ATPase